MIKQNDTTNWHIRIHFSHNQLAYHPEKVVNTNNNNKERERNENGNRTGWSRQGRGHWRVGGWSRSRRGVGGPPQPGTATRSYRGSTPRAPPTLAPPSVSTVGVHSSLLLLLFFPLLRLCRWNATDSGDRRRPRQRPEQRWFRRFPAAVQMGGLFETFSFFKEKTKIMKKWKDIAVDKRKALWVSW